MEGVTCTDGKGSSRSGVYEKLSPEELGEIRKREQEESAKIGGFGIMIQHGYPSGEAVDADSESMQEA